MCDGASLGGREISVGQCLRADLDAHAPRVRVRFVVPGDVERDDAELAWMLPGADVQLELHARYALANAGACRRLRIFFGVVHDV